MGRPTTPIAPRRTEKSKATRCGRRYLRASVYTAAVVAMLSIAHGVGAQETTMTIAHTVDDVVAGEPIVRDTLVQDAPVEGTSDLGEDEGDDGEFPQQTEVTVTPTQAAAPTESAPTTMPTEPTTQAPTPTTTAETPTQPPAPTQATETPTAMPNTNNALSNSASNLRGTANSVSPGLLIGFAVLCTAFLALWIRRRRDSGGVDGGAGGGGSSMSGMATTSSTEKREGSGKKAEYSRLDARAEEEELLEDEFGGRSGSWDDWDNNPSHQRIDIHGDVEDEGTASSNMTPQSPPPLSKSSGSVRTSTAGVKLTSPPPSRGRGGAGHLQDDAASPPPRPTSVASNSSNESFEVVVSPPAAALIDLLSGIPAAPHAESSEASSSVEDDLFSQFGMVPTFKKGVQQASVVAVPPPPPPSSMYVAPSAASLNPFAASPPPPTASDSLFAADMDDMDLTGDVASGANEWGDEEDDWVQGL